ncbi:MAG: hypothetical protein RLZZ511_1985 [Cyanobacteriota bacterium]|jgi:uncharacterized membrane protein YfcA
MGHELLLEMTVGVWIIAFLYSSVGHAGASGYIAVLALCGLAPEVIKPTVLGLNIVVAGIGAWQFWRSGHLSWRLFWRFALLSIPMSFWGGYLKLPTTVFQVFLGVILLLSALRFLVKPLVNEDVQEPGLPIALSVGGGIGLLAGLTGTGGGIFLTPLMYWCRWAKAKQASAVSVWFILVNSVAGLLGNLSSTQKIPSFTGVLVVAVIVGGSLGSYLGSRKFSPIGIQRLLAAVLVIAGLKLILA